MKKIVRHVLGWTIIILGILSLPTPIPGLLIIFAGMAILGIEKERNIFYKLKDKIKRWRKK